jgi:serine/threonine protein kinase
MNFTLPTNDLLRSAFPEINDLREYTRGGFKVVYYATVGETQEIFKLVCLPEIGESDEEKQTYRKESLGRIRREVELLGRCQQPELVKLGTVAPKLVSIEGKEYVGYSEEFLNGENLWKILRRRGSKPPEAEVRRLLLSLFRAIKELWDQHRTVHRDIKPENVIKLEDPERPFVLLDLGIAYGLLDTSLTHNSGIVPCTPRYMAPEMAKPDFRRNLDFRSDLYTSALTAFEYSAQIHPLARAQDDLVQTISRALHQPPRHLKEERPDFMDSFCSLVDQMLKKKPMLRPSELAALIVAMEENR